MYQKFESRLINLSKFQVLEKLISFGSELNSEPYKLYIRFSDLEFVFKIFCFVLASIDYRCAMCNERCAHKV